MEPRAGSSQSPPGSQGPSASGVTTTSPLSPTAGARRLAYTNDVEDRRGAIETAPPQPQQQHPAIPSRWSISRARWSQQSQMSHSFSMVMGIAIGIVSTSQFSQVAPRRDESVDVDMEDVCQVEAAHRSLDDGDIVEQMDYEVARGDAAPEVLEVDSLMDFTEMEPVETGAESGSDDDDRMDHDGSIDRPEDDSDIQHDVEDMDTPRERRQRRLDVGLFTPKTPAKRKLEDSAFKPEAKRGKRIRTRFSRKVDVQWTARLLTRDGDLPYVVTTTPRFRSVMKLKKPEERTRTPKISMDELYALGDDLRGEAMIVMSNPKGDRGCSEMCRDGCNADQCNCQLANVVCSRRFGCVCNPNNCNNRKLVNRSLFETLKARQDAVDEANQQYAGLEPLADETIASEGSVDEAEIVVVVHSDDEKVEEIVETPEDHESPLDETVFEEQEVEDEEKEGGSALDESMIDVEDGGEQEGEEDQEGDGSAMDMAFVEDQEVEVYNVPDDKEDGTVEDSEATFADDNVVDESPESVSSFDHSVIDDRIEVEQSSEVVVPVDQEVISEVSFSDAPAEADFAPSLHGGSDDSDDGEDSGDGDDGGDPSADDGTEDDDDDDEEVGINMEPKEFSAGILEMLPLMLDDDEEDSCKDGSEMGGNALFVSLLRIASAFNDVSKDSGLRCCVAHPEVFKKALVIVEREGLLSRKRGRVQTGQPLDPAEVKQLLVYSNGWTHMVVPMHIGRHWVVTVVKRSTVEAVIYNSSNRNSSKDDILKYATEKKQWTAAIRKVLEAVEALSDEDSTTGRFRVRFCLPKHRDEQDRKDTTNCGIYVLEYCRRALVAKNSSVATRIGELPIDIRGSRNDCLKTVRKLRKLLEDLKNAGQSLKHGPEGMLPCRPEKTFITLRYTAKR